MASSTAPDEISVQITGSMRDLQAVFGQASTLVSNQTKSWQGSFDSFSKGVETPLKSVRMNTEAMGNEMAVSGRKVENAARASIFAFSALAANAKPNIDSVLFAVTGVALEFGAVPGLIALATSAAIHLFQTLRDEASKTAEAIQADFKKFDASLAGKSLTQQIKDLEAAKARAEAAIKQLGSIRDVSSQGVVQRYPELNPMERARLEKAILDFDNRLAALRLQKRRENSDYQAAVDEQAAKDNATDDERWAKKEDFENRVAQHTEEFDQKWADDIKALQLEVRNNWLTVFSPLETSIETFIQKGGNLRDFWRSLWYDIVQTSAKAGLQMVAMHYANELAKNNITAQSVAKRVALEVWAGLKFIAIKAAEGAAAVWAAMASLGPLGVVAGAALAAATFAGIISLAHGIGGGGGGGGPSGGSTRSGGGGASVARAGGGAINVSVYALDGASVYRTLTNNKSEFGRAIRDAVNDGAIRTPGKAG